MRRKYGRGRMKKHKSGERMMTPVTVKIISEADGLAGRIGKIYEKTSDGFVLVEFDDGSILPFSQDEIEVM